MEHPQQKSKGPPVALRLLIEALDRDKDRAAITYGEMAQKLTRKFKLEPSERIIGQDIGPRVAGPLMDEIRRIDSDAPLVNMLVVSKKEEVPGEGLAWYLGKHYDDPSLEKNGMPCRKIKNLIG